MKITTQILFCCSLAFFTYSAKANSQEDLYNACKGGDLAGVEKAIAAGADVNAMDPNGNVALSIAYLWPEIEKLLLQKGANPNGGNYPAIIGATNNYSVEVMKLLLDAGADPNKAGKVDPSVTFKMLIANEQAKGKDANKQMIAAWENVMKSMPPPSDVYAVDICIRQTNCVPCLDLLVKNGVKLDQIDPTTGGNLAHTLAVFGMSREERKEGFAKGVASMASFGMKTPEWYGNLPDEVNGTTAEMMDALIKGGVDIHLLNNDEFNPLITALTTRKLEVAKLLVEAGADVNYLSPRLKKDALSYAAEYGDLELMKALVEKGADVNHETWDLDKETGTFCKGFTALSRATIYDHYDCAKYLIEQGCEIKEGISGYFSKQMYNKKGKLMMDFSGTIPVPLVCRYKIKNKTPVYFAIENGNMELVQLLATSYKWYGNHSMEINPQGGNKEHKAACTYQAGKFSPSRYAKAMEQKEIQKYLESLGK